MSPCRDREVCGVENFVKNASTNGFGWLGLWSRLEKQQRVRVARVRVGSTAATCWTARWRWRVATIKRRRCGYCGHGSAAWQHGGGVGEEGAGTARKARARARKAQRGCRAREREHGEVRQLGETAVLGNTASTGGGLRWKGQDPNVRLKG
jgi:hypothetical protein